MLRNNPLSTLKKSVNNKSIKGLKDPQLHRDIWFLTKRYLKGDAILDFLANIPGLVYILSQDNYMSESDKDMEALFDEDKVFTTFMAFKILRLAHSDEV